jgi:hypothetical protein
VKVESYEGNMEDRLQFVRVASLARNNYVLGTDKNGGNAGAGDNLLDCRHRVDIC